MAERWTTRSCGHWRARFSSSAHRPFRFNFRGVGASEGSHDEGRGETTDALAVIAYGQASAVPGAALWLGGFSFGGVVAVRGRRAGAPRTPRRWWRPASRASTRDGAAPPACPWLIVQGDADDVVPAQAVLDWARALSPAPTVRVLPGAGHYFHGRINELRDTVVDFMGAVPAQAPTAGTVR